jgi:ABC-type Zn uptake system ZnuABC Zn-binding protein ZnuA
MRRIVVLACRAAVFAGLGIIMSLIHVHSAAARTIVVAATTSDVASLVKVVGGDLVQVKTIVPPMMDPEAFEPRASDLATLADADLLVRVGLGYDFWIDRLADQLRRPELQQGGARSVDASAGVPLLEVSGRDPVAQDGHGHALANPHYWLDPANAETITATIAAGIIRLAPGAREAITANRDRFLKNLHERLVKWTRQLAPYRGTAVLAYHNSWPYFARRFRLNVVGFIEPKEGVTPSAAHLSELIAETRRSGVRAILHETYEPKRFSEMLSARTGVPVVVLAPTVGSVPQATDYLSLIDHNVDVLTRALASPGQ